MNSTPENVYIYIKALIFTNFIKHTCYTSISQCQDVIECKNMLVSELKQKCFSNTFV